MKFIMKFIQTISFKELPKPLGRWGLDYCNTKLDHKINLSNEDHCGSCGEYAIIKKDLHGQNISTENHVTKGVNSKV